MVHGEAKQKNWTKKQVSIYLEPEDIEVLDTIAKGKNLSRNKLIEQIIGEFANTI